MKTNTTGRLTLAIFLEFVELKTKVASFFPMVAGFLWSLGVQGKLNGVNTLLFFLAVISFDMCTTAINNTMDYVKAIDHEYRQEENVIGKHGLGLPQMVGILLFLLVFSICLSLILVWRTDILLLPIGMLCFAIGICYTFGPMPLSRLPLGELFSGVTMGFGIFFLAIYVQDPSMLLTSHWTSQEVEISLLWKNVLQILYLSLPFVHLIANIMLANNLCDYEQDLKNERFTLVSYIGKERAIQLYTYVNLSAWLIWISLVIFHQLPIWSLFGLVAFPLNWKALQALQKEQVKSKTFVSSIQSFVLLSTLYLLALGLKILISF